MRASGWLVWSPLAASHRRTAFYMFMSGDVCEGGRLQAYGAHTVCFERDVEHAALYFGILSGRDVEVVEHVKRLLAKEKQSGVA